MRLPWRRDPTSDSAADAFGAEFGSKVHRAFGTPVESVAGVRHQILTEFSATAMRRTAGRRRSWATVAGAALVVVVTVVGGASFGSGPGGPLYTWRLSVESWAFPAATSNARYEAELRYLDARFAELTAAVSSGRPDAAQAAGAAYRAALADLLAMSSMPGVDGDRLGTDLARQSGALASLSAGAPASIAGFLAETRNSVRSAEGAIGASAPATPVPGQGAVAPASSTAPPVGDATPPVATPSPRQGHGNAPGAESPQGGDVHVGGNGNGNGTGGGKATGGGNGTGQPTPTPTPTMRDCGTPSLTEHFTGNGKGAKAHQMTLTGAYRGTPAPSTWKWGFGDAGASGSGQTVKHDFPAAGTYEVTLTVASGACGTTSTSTTVTVP
jgi:hypothetical protein